MAIYSDEEDPNVKDYNRYGEEPAEKAALQPLPEKLDDELIYILGRPNFWCGPVAQLFRQKGAPIPTKSEDEQAYVIHWLLEIYQEHGPEKWREHAAVRLQQIKDQPEVVK